MKLFNILVIVLFPCILFGQDYGYFGKKNVLSFNINGTVPLLYNAYRHARLYNFKEKDGALIRSKNHFDFGVRLGYSHFFTRGFGLGAEANLEFGKIIGPKDLFYQKKLSNQSNPYAQSSVSCGMQHEQLSVRTISFLPKLEFSILNGDLPIGISHELGVGFSMTTAISKDYLMELEPDFSVIGQENYEEAQSDLESANLKPYNKSLFGFTMFYGLNCKMPVSRKILVNIGVRYTLNPTFKNHIGGSDLPEQYQQRIEDEIVDKRVLSIITLNIGVNYVF